MNTHELAKKCNKSISAVYKSLYHKKGVDAKTRETVFAALDAPPPKAQPGKKPSVGIVLPAKPSYYWDALCKGIENELQSGIDAHFVFFSSLGSGHEGVHAIEYVQDLDLCIIAPSVAPSVQARIAALAAEKPILFVSEGLPLPQLATVCNNHYDDGYRLGTAFTEAYPDRKRILTLHVHNGLGAQVITNGFTKAISESGASIIGNIAFDDISAPLASRIARAVKAQYAGKFDVLYCATGITPYVGLALQKLRITDEIICVGYENPKSNAIYIEKGQIGMLSVSNAFKMGQVACRIACDYLLSGRKPSEKTVYIPSEIIKNK